MTTRSAMPEALRTLPAYDLGPGRETDTLVINLILYGMVIALLMSVLWVLLMPFAQDYRERRRKG